MGANEANIENRNGWQLHETAELLEAKVVNTHYNAGATWVGSRGHLSRIDFVLAAGAFFDKDLACMVNEEVDLATSTRQDHKLLQAEFGLHLGKGIRHEPAQGAAAQPLCERKLQEQWRAESLQHHVEKVCYDPNGSVDTWAKQLSDTMSNMRWLFEKERTKRKK